MKFSIEKSVLLEGLDIIKPAIPSKATNDVLKTVYLEAQDNTLYLRGTDRRSDIVVIVPCNVETEGKICVNNLVVSLIPNLSDGGILFDFDEKLVISQGKRKHEVAWVATDKYPNRKKIKRYVEIDPTEIKQALSKASISLSNSNTNRRYLQGFYINPHDNYIVSGDGNRVTTVENLDLPGTITLPMGTSIMSVLSVLNSEGKNTVEIAFGKRTGFKSTRYNKDGEFSMMIDAIFTSLEGEYPDQARRYILDAKKAKIALSLEVDKNILKNILEICRLYSDRAMALAKAGPVILRKTKKGVTLIMNIKGLVDMNEPLECEFEGSGDFEIWFHPGLLLEAVAAVISDKVKLVFYNEKLPFVLLDPDMESYTYLQTLMAMPDKIQEIKQND